ncbi:MAG TPA: DUF6713 family protein [Paludibaculum sp.]
MPLQPTHAYLANTALLIGHQLDSGMRRDWLEFGLPNGEQAFIVSNVALFLIVLFGHHQALERSPYAPGFSLCLGMTGSLTFPLHGIGVQMGILNRFTPVAEALLWAILAASVVQTWLALRELRDRVQALP